MKQKLLNMLLMLMAFTTSSVAWAIEPVDGVYQIATAQDLMDFADLVNEGGDNLKADAVLTADINLAEVLTDAVQWHPIGLTSGAAYAGNFDGAGHTISGFEFTAYQQGAGFIGFKNGGEVKNLTINGKLSSGYQSTGFVGYADGECKLTNIVSNLQIDAAVNGCRCGGIAGQLAKGYIKYCTYTGTMNVIDTANGGNYGGIVGYMWNNAAAVADIQYCIFTGEINKDESSSSCTFGGIVGYCNCSPGVICNNLSYGKVNAPVWGMITGAIKAYKTYKNNWYVGELANGSASTKATDGVVNVESHAVTAEQLTNGYACYGMNGDQKEISWYQNIGEDDAPTFDNTHKQVYASGSNKCDGTPSDKITYTNTAGGEIVTPPHTYENGFCSVCGQVDKDYISPVDGVFQIATGEQLRWFAAYVNEIDNKANAVLTADIDLDGTDVPVIGCNAAHAYAGTFDGAGHTLSNYKLVVSSFAASTGYGFFGNASGATIKNFTIDGEMIFDGTAPADLGCGTIGWPDNNTLIEDVLSKLNITAYISTHTGGMVGSLRTATVNRCEYAGIFDGGGATNGKGGIVGYTNTGTITNCVFSGELSGNANGYYGGILGYVNNGNAKMRNCLVTGTVSNDGCTRLGTLVGALRNIGTYSNNYYVPGAEEQLAVGSGEKMSSDMAINNSTAVDNDQLASGEITWALNGATYIIPNYYQTLGTDETPTLNPESGIVYPTSDGYKYMAGADDYENFLNDFKEYQTELKSEAIAYQTYIDEYMTKIGELSATTYEEFVTAYDELKTLDNQIAKSILNYNAYIAACDEVQKYIDESDLAGKEFDALKRYLNEEVEPGEEFTNGSKPYILKTHTLDDAAITAEKTNVQDLLQKAIAANYEAGSDISDLLVNANMASLTGWNITGTRELSAAGPQPTIRIAGKYAISQQMTNIKNGIYMVRVNAEQVSNGDVSSLYHSGMLKAGDNANYVSLPGEDYISLDDIDDGVNCLLTGEDAVVDASYVNDADEGYVPVSAKGFAYHAHDGRYLNYVAVEVTDGTLSLSLSNEGTQLANNDYLLASDWHVVYLGKDDPTGELAKVLENYSKHAQTIIDFVPSSGLDFDQYPNISAEIKENLQNAIDQSATATTAQQRMELVTKFTSLFKQVYECRLAYRKMVSQADHIQNVADGLQTTGVIDDAAYDAMIVDVMEAWDSYEQGSVSADEALAIAKKLETAGGILPEKDADGNYLISKPLDLCVFSSLVTGGELSANAKLTADIDMQGVSFATIGEHGYTNPYAGTFDGQNHTISNLTVESAEGWTGMFSTVTGTIKDLNLVGGSITATTGINYVGIVGYLSGGTMQNVHSSVNVIAETAGSTHFGGLVGDARSNAKVIGCTFSGTVDAGSSTDCFGGIVGYTSGVAINSCLFNGIVKGDESNTSPYVGGILAYANTTAVEMTNNLSVGTVLIETGAALTGSFRSTTPGTFTNNYYLESTAAKACGMDVDMPSVNSNSIVASAELLASGEVAYKLNGDQKTIYFRQNLGEDAYPVLDATHKMVYATGAFTCEGVAKGDVAYSNNNEAIYDEHQFVDGACSVCGLDADGKYLINTPAQLVAFRDKVNAGQACTMDARLGADIDCSEIAWEPIGSSAYAYKAVFDGQGHSLKGIKYTAVADGAGVFGYIKGADIKNLTIDGEMDFAGFTYAGAAAGYVDDNSHITNIVSHVKITVSRAGARVGGIVGQLVRGYVDRCYYDGDMYATDNGNGGNYGGIVGYMMNSSAAVAVITNNIYNGTITKDASQSSCTFGGIVGYCNCAPGVICNNLSLGTVEAPVWGMITGAIKNYTTYTNNWYVGELANSSASTKAEDGNVNKQSFLTNDTDLASGMVCYELNGDQSDIAFYQTLGKDAHPVLDATHLQVMKADDGTYYNGTTTVEGDLNKDGVVDGTDIVILVNIVCGNVTDETIKAAANLNGDSIVDGSDIVILVNKVISIVGIKEYRLMMKRLMLEVE